LAKNFQKKKKNTPENPCFGSNICKQDGLEEKPTVGSLRTFIPKQHLLFMHSKACWWVACCRFVLVAGEEKGFAGHMLQICTYTYSHREQAQ